MNRFAATAAIAVVVVSCACGRVPAPPPNPPANNFADVQAKVAAYDAAHPGVDGDINDLSAAAVAADADAAALLAICGDEQRPVIPLLAWEHGGGDHPWIKPDDAALVYCVYTPVSQATEHWAFSVVDQTVTADVYVLFPGENPCKDEQGRDVVAACIGDVSNFEILVDTASYNDGADAGFDLAEASTSLQLVLDDGSRVELVTD